MHVLFCTFIHHRLNFSFTFNIYSNKNFLCNKGHIAYYMILYFYLIMTCLLHYKLVLNAAFTTIFNYQAGYE